MRKISENGRMVQSSAPYKAEYIIEHTRRFILTLNPDAWDVLLHALQRTAMNFGMRFYELMKVRMDTLKCTKFAISFYIEERTRTEFQGYRYALGAYPGAILNNCVLMDPQIALCNRVLFRGDTPGFLFCNVVEKEYLWAIHEEPWGKDSCVESMRRRLDSISIPVARVKKITGHRARRWGIQLLRYLGVKDSCILRWFGIKSEHAYLRYTELCNEGEKLSVPYFTSMDAILSHAQASSKKDYSMERNSFVDVEQWLN